MLTEWTCCACHHPDFDALCVEVVSDIAGQWCDETVLSEVHEADGACLLVGKDLLIPGSPEHALDELSGLVFTLDLLPIHLV